jgi:hypothetical protein
LDLPVGDQFAADLAEAVPLPEVVPAQQGLERRGTPLANKERDHQTELGVAQPVVVVAYPRAVLKVSIRVLEHSGSTEEQWMEEDCKAKYHGEQEIAGEEQSLTVAGCTYSTVPTERMDWEQRPQMSAVTIYEAVPAEVPSEVVGGLVSIGEDTSGKGLRTVEGGLAGHRRGSSQR